MAGPWKEGLLALGNHLFSAVLWSGWSGKWLGEFARVALVSLLSLTSVGLSPQAKAHVS